MGRFDQHFMCSFYANRSQKSKKDSQVKQLFMLSGSAHVKAALRHVDEIGPRLPWFDGLFFRLNPILGITRVEKL